MKIQTINQLVSVWKDIATRHYQINGFGIGDEWEIGADKAYMHPVLWINPVTASMPETDYGYKTFEIDFEIRIFDLVNKDESNENDVLSDTIDILKDIIAEFKGHPYYVNSQLNIIGDIDFEAFTESFDEEVSGWSCDISLMTPVLTTFCGIPATDITGFEFPGVDCPEVNVLCPVFVEDVTGVYPIVVTTTGTTKEVSIDSSGLTDTFVVSGNYNSTTENLELLRNDGVTVLTDLSSIGGGGTDTNTFLVSGLFDNSTNELELTMNDGTVIDVDLSALKDDTNTHLSTTNFNDNNDNTLVSTLNDGTVINTLIDNFDGLDVTGTINATSFVGDGSGLTNLPSSGGGGDNISNADLTFDATYNADLNGNDWSIKNGTIDYFNIKSTGEFIIGKNAKNLSTSSNKHKNIVIGESANTTAVNIAGCVAIGNSASSSNTNAVAIGTSAIASGHSSIAIKGLATKTGAIAIGHISNATGNNYSIAIGVSSTASSNKTIALGNNSLASGVNSMSLGYLSNATSTNSLSLGTDAKSLASQGVALGSHLEVNHNNSIILGSGINAVTGSRLSSTATNQFVVGFDSTTPTMVIGATSDSYIKSTGTFTLETDTTVKGSDTSEVTSGFKVTDVNEDTTLDVRNNGQIGYGGVFLNTVAHKFRNPNNEAIIASFDNDTANTESFIVEQSGRIRTQNSGQDVFLTTRQSGQSYIRLYDAGVESIRFNKVSSWINGTLKIGGASGSTTPISGAVFEIAQPFTNSSYQRFFANARMTTTGRINSSSSFGTAEAGFECYDTTLNKKFFWNGSAWEMITSS